MTPFRCDRILVPTDFSPFADEAVRYAHGLAERCGAELHVLHVTDDEAERLRLLSGTVGADAGGRPVLSDLLGEPGGVRREEVVWTRPDVPGAIVEYAHDRQIDLVVMASHGRSGLTELFLGSTAEQVSRTAPCPVLIVRARADR